MILASVDPGVRASGLAIWHDGRLTMAKLLCVIVTLPDIEAWFSMATLVREEIRRRGEDHEIDLVVEFPRTYGGRSALGDTDDLLRLAGAVGAIVTQFTYREMKLVRPQDWKGQTPKAVMEKRVRGKLSAEELSRVVLPTRSLAHNVWDAIGIGLHALGR